MAVPFGMRFAVDFDVVFPLGAYIVGEVVPVTEYQSQEDKARNRPVRPRIDEATGLPLYKVTVADPSAEKDRDKSITVEIASKVQPRAETSGQAKWITWVVRATGLRAVDAPPAKSTASKSAAA